MNHGTYFRVFGNEKALAKILQSYKVSYLECDINGPLIDDHERGRRRTSAPCNARLEENETIRDILVAWNTIRAFAVQKTRVKSRPAHRGTTDSNCGKDG